MRYHALAAAIGALCTVSAVHAQTINVDFGDASGTPTSEYAAAGMPGVWNAITDTSSPASLVNVAGELTAATLSIAPNGVSLGSTTDQSTTGDDASLLRDFLRPDEGDMVTVEFANLEPGPYRVITYAVGGQTEPMLSWVWTNDELGDNVIDLFGVTGNGLEPLLTHSEHIVDVTSEGTLTVTVKGQGTAFVNGIQLIPVPAPSVLGLMLISTCMPTSRRRRR